MSRTLQLKKSQNYCYAAQDTLFDFDACGAWCRWGTVLRRRRNRSTPAGVLEANTRGHRIAFFGFRDLPTPSVVAPQLYLHTCILPYGSTCIPAVRKYTHTCIALSFSKRAFILSMAASACSFPNCAAVSSFSAARKEAIAAA